MTDVISLERAYQEGRTAADSGSYALPVYDTFGERMAFRAGWMARKKELLPKAKRKRATITTATGE